VSRAGDRGRDGENLIVEVLRSAGYPNAERRRQGGAYDRGDIAGVPDVVIEAKAAPARYEISEWLKECDKETANDDAHLGVVWFKLRGSRDPLQWPVMMRGRLFLPLLERWTDARR
jgi:hypothetical protein